MLLIYCSFIAIIFHCFVRLLMLSRFFKLVISGGKRRLLSLGQVVGNSSKYLEIHCKVSCDIVIKHVSHCLLL